MSTWLVSMMRNEQDIAEAFVRHHASQVDGMLIADNLSDDFTRDILTETAASVTDCPVIVVDDDDPAYRQSEKMTALAHRARIDHGAEWIVPADADEFWQAHRMPTVAELCAVQPDEVGVLPAAIFNHVVTDTEGFAHMTHRRAEPAPLHKVACRAREDLVIEMGNHQATYTDPHPQAVFGLLTVRHFPIRSVAQYIRKARQGSAALALTDLPESTGQHWRDWGRLTDAQLAAVFAEHWTYDPTDPSVVCDPL